MNYLKSFKIAECDKISLNYYKKLSYHSPEKTVEITEMDEIERVLAILNKLPEKGDEMISMGPVAIIKASFFLKEETVGYLEYYGGLLKMPDTSFCSEKSDAERELYDLFQSKLKI